MKAALLARWYSERLPPLVFIPLSYLYQGWMAVRRRCYQQGILPSTHFTVPIIVVGNLTVGGTGKTPLVRWLIECLRRYGWHPGVVSRGYGGKASRWPQPVTISSHPDEVGDEAVMLVQQTECPLWVGPDRVAAVRALLAHHACDIVISDDGLQHLALGRQLEIVVIDGERRWGNQYCLPAGPLRESLNRLQSVDFCVSTEIAKKESSRLGGTWSMYFMPGPLCHITGSRQPMALEDWVGKEVHAIAGIGHPQRFFRQLQALGITFTPHAFADHYRFRPEDIDFGKNSVVLMTEKDAVKCRAFADERHGYLPIQAQLDDAFTIQLLQRLNAIRSKTN